MSESGAPPPPRRSGFASAADFARVYASDPSLGQEEAIQQDAMKKTKAFQVAPTQTFLKPIQTSMRTPLKGSQGKKIRSTFADLFKWVSEAEWEAVWPKKANVVTEKLSGNGLKDLEHKPLLYWIQSDESSSKNDIGRPSFIDFSGGHHDSHMVYPTIYALAIAPSLMRPMYVHPGVSSYIVDGADCMWPGVISEPDAEYGVGRFQFGERRALIARGNPIPFAVGWLSQDSASVIAAQRTGKALSIVHAYGDELWKVGSQQPPNVGFVKDRVYAIRMTGEEAQEDDEEDENEQGEQKTSEVTSGVENLQLNGEKTESHSSTDTPVATDKATESLSTDIATSPGDVAADGDELDDDAAGDDGESFEDDDDEDDDGSAKMTSDEMDQAMLRAFLFAIQVRIKDEDLPMSVSTVLSHMDACHLSDERLNVKRSTYKKMTKFMKDLGKMNLARSKTGGGKQGMCNCELQLMSVNRSSPLLKEAVVTNEFKLGMKRLQKEKEKQHAKGAAAAEASSSSASSASASSGNFSTGKLKILHMYKPDQKLHTCFFTQAEEQKRLWQMKDAKQVLWDYLTANSLDLGAKVLLNDDLFKTFYRTSKESKAPRGIDRNRWQEYLQHGGDAVRIEVMKAELSSKFDELMIEYYALVHGSNYDESDLTFKRGPLPTISVSLHVKQKKTTKVSGLDVYGIDPLVFAKDAQKMFACSTSTEVIPPNSHHKAYVEVTIQGDVRKDVGPKLQDAYGIPIHCVQVVAASKK